MTDKRTTAPNPYPLGPVSVAALAFDDANGQALLLAEVAEVTAPTATPWADAIDSAIGRLLDTFGNLGERGSLPLSHLLPSRTVDLEGRLHDYVPHGAEGCERCQPPAHLDRSTLRALRIAEVSLWAGCVLGVLHLAH